MMLLKFCIGLLLLLCSVCGFSQEIPVKIQVLNSKKEPVASASLKVHELKDSTSKFELVSNDKGIAELSLVKDKAYKLIFSSVDYAAFSKTFTPSDKQSEFIFTADQKTQTLTDVVVVARKPLMRQEDDKTIVDPEPLAETSTNAYEILEKTPGIFVDQEGNVYLNSTTPAQVYINGRETRMSASDLGSLLKSLPPNAIARMEIMRTPSAKFDASGGGGIINL
ncbi:MAG: TonB-dependent receptor plug domain-containing protein, partial [Flavitalea sp.]